MNKNVFMKSTGQQVQEMQWSAQADCPWPITTHTRIVRPVGITRKGHIAEVLVIRKNKLRFQKN